jgi:hypothetical protein
MEGLVPHTDLIDSLIATYRTLNLTIRPLQLEQALTPGSGGKSVRDLIADLRERELITSQQLKNMTIADTTVAPARDMTPPDPADDQNVRVLLSEFGTAREAILALVREMSDEQWEMEREGPNGMTSIQAVIQDLVSQDQQYLSQLQALLPTRA